jgi:hypothetical protein
MDVPVRVVSGLTPPPGSARGGGRQLPHGVVLYVLPSDADLEQAVEDVAFFVAAMEGRPAAAAGHPPFPSQKWIPTGGWRQTWA